MPPPSKTRLRSMVISAAMGALALVLPVVFHMLGLGSRFLPMLLPLLMNSCLSSWRWALGTGLAVPWISALATGMPPVYPPVAAVMSLEAAVMATGAALTRRMPVFWSVSLTVLCGRLAAFGGAWTLARLFGLPPAFSSAAILIQGLPGVALQVAVVPLLLTRLARREGNLFR
jgi:hypothetical protein